MEEQLIFFNSPEAFYEWLSKHHRKENALWVGYYKVATGKASMSWEESVRAALCFGWIDGIRKSVDEESYKIRFTPRRADSHWSAKNIRMVGELKAEGRMKDAGIEAFSRRQEKNSKQASYEKESYGLSEEYKEIFKEQPEAWHYFKHVLPPGYTRQSVHWVMSAKQEKTRLKRLNILIEVSGRGEKIPLLQR